MTGAPETSAATRLLKRAAPKREGVTRRSVRLNPEPRTRSLTGCPLAGPAPKRERVKGRAKGRSCSAQAGITLIEMLVVMTIIALFAALVGPSLLKHGDTARITAARAQIESFDTALGAYKLDTGTFPTTEQGLQALRVKPPDVNQWAGPYMPKDIPLDPWGHPYVYKYPGEHGDEPDIICYGADGAAGGDGLNADIVSWKNN